LDLADTVSKRLPYILLSTLLAIRPNARPVNQWFILHYAIYTSGGSANSVWEAGIYAG